MYILGFTSIMLPINTRVCICKTNIHSVHHAEVVVVGQLDVAVDARHRQGLQRGGDGAGVVGACKSACQCYGDLTKRLIARGPMVAITKNVSTTNDINTSGLIVRSDPSKS